MHGFYKYCQELHFINYCTITAVVNSHCQLVAFPMGEKHSPKEWEKENKGGIGMD